MLFAIPESAPWLLATGRRKRAIRTLNYIAWFNGSTERISMDANFVENARNDISFDLR